MKVNNVILQTVTKVATYIILTFAIYLFLAGHHNPGGGFIGGLVIASAVALLVLVYDVKTLKAVFPFDFKILAAVGVLIAVVTGMGSFVFGKPFLSQSFGYFNLPIFGETELATAVIFDVGVALAVLGTALSIIFTISEDISLWKH
ncbi:MAG: Na(+)/H(+) antiporter subunit B [Clostridia bacterium]|jgi:multicomponent Na+:H+ antiporter subunit B|nr:Na(+)/H(+) antiporter subunit B [Clostridia bacterium]